MSNNNVASVRHRICTSFSNSNNIPSNDNIGKNEVMAKEQLVHWKEDWTKQFIFIRREDISQTFSFVMVESDKGS